MPEESAADPPEKAVLTLKPGERWSRLGAAAWCFAGELQSAAYNNRTDPVFKRRVLCVCVKLGKDAGRALFHVCRSLMVRSCGRPGHPRLGPDNEHDEDGWHFALSGTTFAVGD